MGGIYTDIPPPSLRPWICIYETLCQCHACGTVIASRTPHRQHVSIQLSFRISRLAAGPQDIRKHGKKFRNPDSCKTRETAPAVDAHMRRQSESSWHGTSLSWSKSISPRFIDSATATAVQCARELWPLTPGWPAGSRSSGCIRRRSATEIKHTAQRCASSANVGPL